MLSSVNWPLNYPIHEDWCEHQIRPSSGKQTKIVFMDVNVATDGRSGCGYDDDFLEVKGLILLIFLICFDVRYGAFRENKWIPFTSFSL